MEAIPKSIVTTLVVEHRKVQVKVKKAKEPISSFAFLLSVENFNLNGSKLTQYKQRNPVSRPYAHAEMSQLR